jgi:hypothetical protein
MPPLLDNKNPSSPSVFRPAALSREVRRQKSIPRVNVPTVCILDPDGEAAAKGRQVKTFRRLALLSHTAKCLRTSLANGRHHRMCGRRECPLRVKSEEARTEHFMSAFHPIVDRTTDALGGPLCAINAHPLGSVRAHWKASDDNVKVGGGSRIFYFVAWSVISSRSFVNAA